MIPDINGKLSTIVEINAVYESDDPKKLSGHLSVLDSTESAELTGHSSTIGELNVVYDSDDSKKLNGYLSVPEELTSTYGDMQSIELKGHLSIPDRIGEKYKGSYEVIPTADFQLLPTAECYLVDDVLIHPIPYSEVRNEQGGITVTIGE